MSKTKHITLLEAAEIITNGFRLTFSVFTILCRTQGGLL